MGAAAVSQGGTIRFHTPTWPATLHPGLPARFGAHGAPSHRLAASGKFPGQTGYLHGLMPGAKVRYRSELRAGSQFVDGTKGAVERGR